MRSEPVHALPDDPASAGDQSNVISIRTGRPIHAAPEQPGADNGDLEQFTHTDEPDDFWHRMRMNAIAFGFVALLVIAALWLANSIATMRKDQDCVLSGKRGCSPVETTARPS